MREIAISGGMKIADIIMADQRAMVLLPRFGIEMGFGDKTVKQVCQEQEIQLDFFLLMANIFLHPHYFPDKKLKNVDVKLLLLYLANAHDYYIREKIPHIRQHVEQLLGILTHQAKGQLEMFFNQYIQEVLDHIEYEEKVVFPYIKNLMLNTGEQLPSEIASGYGIREFEARHNNIEEKLSDLKNLLIKYFPPDNDRYLRIRVLNELFDLEQDLSNHARLEDKVLIPIVESFEKQNLTQ